MNCDRSSERMIEYVLEELEEEDRREIAEHLATGCQRCCAELVEIEQACAVLATALEPSEPSEHLEQRLLARVRRSTKGVSQDAALQSVRAGLDPVSGRSRRRRAAWLAAGTAAAAVATFVTLGTISWYRSTASRSAAGERTPTAELEQLRQRLDATHRIFQSANLRFVSLQATGPGIGIGGYIVWDRFAHQLHVYVFDLAIPPPSRTYQLWLIGNDDRWIPAGTFDIASDGTGQLVADIPTDLGPIARAAITEEPAGGADQPSGHEQFHAEL